jgi:alkaline phosphatase D
MGDIGGFSRRRFLALAAMGLAGPTLAAACSSGGDGGAAATSTSPAAPPGGATGPDGSAASLPVPTFATSPFTLGVASGDPLADSVILWTRLALEPLDGGGMGAEPVPVRWEVASDDTFASVVAEGTAVATEDLAHSVHVDVTGLDADTWYAYRFRVGDHVSATGRTRTVPADGDLPAGGRMRFGFTSCQNWTAGHYTGYPHLVDEQLDLVFHLGDYIYEGGPGGDTAVRRHNSDEVRTLVEYRNRYGLYKSDPNLQAAHAACPWVTTWDDHEVDNNYADDLDGADVSDGFLERRAAAYRASYEHQPLRLAVPDGPDFDIYRAVTYGSLARFFVIDTRQHRSNQACVEPGADFGPSCPEVDEPGRTMLGAEQRAWLLDGLASTRATWNVIANQTVMTKLPLGGVAYNFDQWDGYPADRAALTAAMAERADLNPIVITGDIHAFGVGDLTADGGDPAAPVVGTEFVGGSMTSVFPDQFADIAQEAIGGLPQIRYVDVRGHGYGVCELTGDSATVSYRVVSTTAEPTADISTEATFVVDAGRPGARRI